MSRKITVFIAILFFCTNCCEMSAQAAVGHAEVKRVWLVGTWREMQPEAGNRCLQITEDASKQLTGWLFEETARGQSVSAGAVKVHPFKTGVASIERYANSAVCCSHSFLATSTKNGTVMRANWSPGPNQAPHISQWKKMSGDGCSVR
jgi:hypothetical protein